MGDTAVTWGTKPSCWEETATITKAPKEGYYTSGNTQVTGGLEGQGTVCWGAMLVISSHGPRLGGVTSIGVSRLPLPVPAEGEGASLVESSPVI